MPDRLVIIIKRGRGALAPCLYGNTDLGNGVYGGYQFNTDDPLVIINDKTGDD